MHDVSMPQSEMHVRSRSVRMFWRLHDSEPAVSFGGEIRKFSLVCGCVSVRKQYLCVSLVGLWVCVGVYLLASSRPIGETSSLGDMGGRE